MPHKSYKPNTESGLIPPHGGYKTLELFKNAMIVYDATVVFCKSYMTYKTSIEENAKTAANALVCLIHQTNYLLDQQLCSLEKSFLKNGGFTERLYHARKNNK